MRLEISVGRPITRRGVSLFPLYNHQTAAPGYLSGPAAEREGVLAVDERETAATVPELAVRNRGPQPVLLVEGETILGNKQNRTLNVSVIVPAEATVAVPVSCVEQGRWGAPQPAQRSEHHAPLELRALKTRSVGQSVRSGGSRDADQAAVWDEVERQHRLRAVDAPTAALEDAYRAPHRARQALLSIRPLPHQTGVIVAVGGRVRALDMFDKPSTLADYWAGLLDGYALDADHGDDPPAASRGLTMDAVFQFLHRVESAPVTEATTGGLGRELHFASPVAHGSALAWEDGLVHLAAFA